MLDQACGRPAGSVVVDPLHPDRPPGAREQLGVPLVSSDHPHRHGPAVDGCLGAGGSTPPGSSSSTRSSTSSPAVLSAGATLDRSNRRAGAPSATSAREPDDDTERDGGDEAERYGDGGEHSHEAQDADERPGRLTPGPRERRRQHGDGGGQAGQVAPRGERRPGDERVDREGIDGRGGGGVVEPVLPERGTEPGDGAGGHGHGDLHRPLPPHRDRHEDDGGEEGEELHGAEQGAARATPGRLATSATRSADTSLAASGYASVIARLSASTRRPAARRAESAG